MIAIPESIRGVGTRRRLRFISEVRHARFPRRVRRKSGFRGSVIYIDDEQQLGKRGGKTPDVFVCLVNVGGALPARVKLTRAHKRNEPGAQSSSMYESKWEHVGARGTVVEKRGEKQNEAEGKYLRNPGEEGQRTVELGFSFNSVV